MADSWQFNAQLGRSTNLRFIVLYEGDFEHVNDEWKWRGSETTSLLVPSDITLPGLVARLMEKLHIRDPSTQIELKFKIPNRNVPPMKILDNEDLKHYISLHMEADLCVTLRKTEVPNGLHIARNMEMKDHTFVAKEGNSGNHRLDIGQIFLEAQHRWLESAEICEILQNYTKIGLTPDPPNRPASGSLFLFDRKVLRYFRKDGHNWRKKKDGKTVREANERLKVEGVEVLHCYYAHGEEDQDFQRRIYWMLNELSHIVLVHYRDVKANRNRTNFNCYREPEVIPDSQEPRENIHNAEVDGSLFSEIRPNSYERTFQVVDSAILDRAHVSEFENAESVYCHQQSPGFQSFDNVLQPMVHEMRDGSIPYWDVPISDNYQGQFSDITGASFESITQGEKNKNSMDNGLTYELPCDQSWKYVMDGSTDGFQDVIFQPESILREVGTMLEEENEWLGEALECNQELARGPCCEILSIGPPSYRSSYVEVVDIADAGSIISGETVLHMRFLKLLSLGSIQTSVQKGAAENNLCSKISSLLKDDNEWEQTLNLTVQDEFSADRVQDRLLLKLLKEKLYYWLLQKVAEGGKGPNTLDEGGQGVLHFAAALGYNWAIQPTIAAGVSVNFQDANGWTALHWAAYYGRERLVVFLISIGAAPGALTDPTPKCPSGRTPADLASCNGHEVIVGYLLQSALSEQYVSLVLKNSKEGNNEEKAVETVFERTETFVGYGNVPHGLSLKNSLAAVCNATQDPARIHQAFRFQSFQRKQTEEYGGGEFGKSAERVISLLALKGKKTGQHDEPMHVAVISIQNKFRSWKGRRAYLLIRQQIIKIQAHVRGHQVRKKYKMIIWSGSILSKVILHWRRKGRGSSSFKPEALTAGTSVQETEPKKDDYDFLNEGRKQTEERLQKALARVKSMVQYPEARDQYRRLLQLSPKLRPSVMGS